MSNTTLPPSLQRLVNIITEAINQKGQLSPLKAKELVLKADVQAEDLKRYADFDHPTEDCYGRQLVYDAGSFEVMVMSWNPGDYSSIHNHGYTEWGVVQVFGPTHHLIYQLKNDELDFAKRELLPAKTAIKVNNALIHQMGNATTSRYLTLHVYGSNSLSGEITADAKNFDLELGRVAYTCGGAFFNLPEEAVSHTEQGPAPSQPVFLHHAHLLMDYYNRQLPSPEVLTMKDQLLEKMKACIFESSEAPTSV